MQPDFSLIIAQAVFGTLIKCILAIAAGSVALIIIFKGCQIVLSQFGYRYEFPKTRRRRDHGSIKKLQYHATDDQFEIHRFY